MNTKVDFVVCHVFAYYLSIFYIRLRYELLYYSPKVCAWWIIDFLFDLLTYLRSEERPKGNEAVLDIRF